MTLFSLLILWILFLLAFLPGQGMERFPSARQSADLNSAFRIPGFRKKLVFVSILGAILIASGMLYYISETYLAIHLFESLANPHEWWGGPTNGPQMDNIGVSYEDWAKARRQPYESILPVANREVIARILLGERMGLPCYTRNPEACSLVNQFGRLNRVSFLSSFLVIFSFYFIFVIFITWLQLPRPKGMDDY